MTKKVAVTNSTLNRIKPGNTNCTYSTYSKYDIDDMHTY